MQVREEVLEGGPARDDGRLPPAVHRPNQRVRQVQDVTVEQVRLLTQQHRQRLRTEGSTGWGGRAEGASPLAVDLWGVFTW